MIAKEYWAGLFDGEGCVYIQRHTQKRGFGICVSVTQKKPEILYLLQGEFNGKVKLKQHRPNPCYQWRVTSLHDIKNFCEAIFPFVFIKKNDLNILFEFMKTYTPWNSGYRKLTDEELNRRMDLMAQIKVGRLSGTVKTVAEKN